MNGAISIDNARIWTGDPQRPWAGSISIRNGRIESLDGLPAVKSRWDAGGRFVLPGLIDAHLHLLLGGQSLDRLDLSAVSSRDEFERAIADRSRELAKDDWLIAFGWTSEHLGADTDSGEPDKSWLAGAGDRPVVCYRMDHHAVLVNDAVLSRCDLRSVPSTGQVIRHRETGEPTGVLLEAAAWERVNPIIPQPIVEQKLLALRRAQQHCHSTGLTSIGSMEYIEDVVTVFAPMRHELTLRCRVTILDRPPMAPGGAPPFERTRSVAADDHLEIIGFKSFIDGTLGSRTARMLDDYADDPGNRGMLVELAAQGGLAAWVRGVAAAGYSPSMHAIGDEAVRIALDAIDEAEPFAPHLHARIEHAQHVAAPDLKRFRSRIASMQPLHKVDDAMYAARCLAAPQLAGMFAFQSLLEAGVMLAFGSDWPIVSCDPMSGMAAAITGRNGHGEIVAPRQNLRVEQALAAYTGGSARALRMSDAGMLREGFAGDCVVLDRNPFQSDWNDGPPRVLLTISGGEVVYDAR